MFHRGPFWSLSGLCGNVGGSECYILITLADTTFEIATWSHCGAE